MNKRVSTLLFVSGFVFLSCSDVVAMKKKGSKTLSSSFSGMVGNYIKKNIWTPKTKMVTGFGAGFAGMYVFGQIASRKVRRFVGFPNVGLAQCLFGGSVVGAVMVLPSWFKKIKNNVAEIGVTTKDTNEEVKKLKKITKKYFECLNKKVDDAHIGLAEGIAMVDINVINLTEVVKAGFQDGAEEARKMFKSISEIHSGQATILSAVNNVSEKVDKGNVLNVINAKVLCSGKSHVTNFLRENFNKSLCGKDRSTITFEDL